MPYLEIWKGDLKTQVRYLLLRVAHEVKMLGRTNSGEKLIETFFVDDVVFVDLAKRFEGCKSWSQIYEFNKRSSVFVINTSPLISFYELYSLVFHRTQIKNLRSFSFESSIYRLSKSSFSSKDFFKRSIIDKFTKYSRK